MSRGCSTGSMAGDVWFAVRVVNVAAWILGPVVGVDTPEARVTVAILVVVALLVARWEGRAEHPDGAM